MVQTFLWMQLNKKKDNLGMNRQGLARLLQMAFVQRSQKLQQKMLKTTHMRCMPSSKRML